MGKHVYVVFDNKNKKISRIYTNGKSAEKYYTNKILNGHEFYYIKLKKVYN